MANRVPLILNTSSNQIQELPTGDNLDLSNSGINNAGVVTATTFSGSFSGDGSALTGLTAAGTGAIGGLTVKDEGSVVGTAGSISSFDFRGSYITATANTGAAGVTTVTLSETPTFSTVTVTNNINANGNIVGDNSTNITGIAGVTATNLTGTLQTAAQPNITSLGSLSSLNVIGNVSVGGTLTYEDVTNVDSVGIATARVGLKVLSGGINAVGVVTATSFTGSIAASNIDSGTVATARLGSGTANSSSFLRGDQTWATVSGTTINNNADNRLITGSGTANTLEAEANLTFDGSRLHLPDEKSIEFGDGYDLGIGHTSFNGYIHNKTNSLTISSQDHVKIRVRNLTSQYSGGDKAIECLQGGTVELYGANAKKLETTSSGVTVTGTVAATAFTGDGSALTGITGTTINNNADNRVITGSGTANTLEGESTFTYDGSALKVKSTHSLASWVQRTDGVWGNWSPEFNFKATGASPAGTTFGQWGNHAEGHQIVFVKSRDNGNSGTTCQAGDDLGSIFWSPYNSNNPGCAAAVKVMASGAYSSTSNPAYMQIMTTPDGSKEPTERVRIGSHGGVIFKGGPLQEKVKITAGKLSNNTNIDLADGNVHYFTTQESTTSTPNLRVNSTTMLNSVMEVGETVAVTLITTAGSGGYSAALQIHGNNQTVNWVGASAPAAGGSSGVDIYNYTIIKTGNSAFTVIGNLTKTS